MTRDIHKSLLTAGCIAGLLHFQAAAQARYAELGVYDLPRAPNVVTDVMLAADVDGDGDLDVLSVEVAAVGTGRTLALLRNDGTGRFIRTAEQVLDGFTVKTIAVGDIDGDGDGDVVLGTTTNTGSRQIKVVRFDAGSGQFQGFDRYAGDGSQSLEVVDIDGDGDRDFLATGPADFLLFRNDGTGAFAAAAPPFAGVVRPFAVGFADLDGDLDQDAVVTQGSSLPPLLFRNDGGGVFVLEAGSGLPAAASGTITFADIDGDADPDIHLSGIALVENLGGLRFRDASARAPGMALTLDAEFADVDGDGDVDLLYLEQDVLLALFHNDGSGRFARAAAPVVPSRQSYTQVLTGDVDNDGDADLLVHAPYGQDQLLVNDGGGSFHNVTRGGFFYRTVNGFPNNTYISGQVTCDYDRDGDLDVVAASNRSVRLLRNDGWGGFADVTAASFPYLNLPAVTALLAVDVDDDGDLDLVLGRSAQTALYVNEGNGRFSDGTLRMPADNDVTWALSSLDVDNDGHVDLVLGNLGQDRIYRNDGTGRFLAASGRLPADPSETIALVAADLDRDGDDDLVRGTRTGLSILDNRAGVFVDVSAARLPTLTAEILTVEVADVDGDGDLDLVFGGIGTLKLYLNSGSGTFADESARLPSLGTGEATVIRCVDFDEDGDSDLFLGKAWRDVTGNLNPLLNRFFRNDGSGTFSRGFTDLPDEAGITRSLSVADLDGDGDPDLLVGEDQVDETRLLLNLRRHLHVRRLPIPGGRIDIDVTVHPGASAPGNAAALRLGPGEARIPLPPFGVFGLDPVMTLFFPAVPIAAPAGELTFSFVVPPLVELKGTRWFTQAFLVIGGNVADWRLTGRETFVIH